MLEQIDSNLVTKKYLIGDLTQVPKMVKVETDPVSTEVDDVVAKRGSPSDVVTLEMVSDDAGDSKFLLEVLDILDELSNERLQEC